MDIWLFFCKPKCSCTCSVRADRLCDLWHNIIFYVWMTFTLCHCDERAGHTLSPLNEPNLPHTKTHVVTYSVRTHTCTRPINTHLHTHAPHSLPRTLLTLNHRPLTGTGPDFSRTRHKGSKANSVVWKWGGGLKEGSDREGSHIPFGFLWSKRPEGLRGGTLLKNTCDNDVIWVLARSARQLLTAMM